MTPLLSDERIAELEEQVTIRSADSEGAAVEWAIRQAIREAGEACAKMCDERIAGMLAHTNQDGLLNGWHMFEDEIEALTEAAQAIRAALTGQRGEK